MQHHTALMIVDVQLDMFEAEPVEGGDELLTVLAALIERARSAAAPVVYIQHSGAPGSGLERGSPGWPIHPRIGPEPGEWVIEKSEPDSFQGTDLDARLRANDIDRLIITGTHTDYCVDTTVRSAFSHGYDVVLVEDGHATCDNGVIDARRIVAHHNLTLGRFATVTPAAAVAFS